MSFKELDRHFEDLQKKIVGKLKARKDKNLYESDLLISGLTSRAISLNDGLKESHEKSNPYVFVTLYRAQIETLATINYLLEHPSEIKTFLHGGRKGTRYKIKNILTLIDGCKHRYPKLREIYDSVSEMAHPNSASHFLSTQKEGNVISWRSKPSFTKQESQKALKGAIEICRYVANDLGLLVEKIMK